MKKTNIRFIKISLVVFLLFFFLILVFGKRMNHLFLIGLILVMGFVSQIPKRILKIPTGLELNVFITIFFSIVYNPFVGIVLSLLNYSIGTIGYAPISFFAVFMFVITAIFSGFFNTANIVSAGIILSILYNFSMLLYSYIIFKSELAKSILISSVNLVLNYYLFSVFSPLLLRIFF
ncbi:hypothetical protein GF327_10105 [Candidatus Woesearchaeota archaeon]|nr:hypothetical protein [Candidatus Woesearchaeota archaeon]